MYCVYLISSTEANGKKTYKIGRTKRDPQIRMKELATGNHNQLEIEHVFTSRWGTKIESHLHRKYKNINTSGEWFQLSDRQVDEFIAECQSQHDMFEFLLENNTWFQEQPEFKKFI